MNGFAVEKLIETLKSIDDKLGRIADALEKNVGKDVDLSVVLDEVVAAEKGESESVVEEWDDDRILRQFVEMDAAERGFVWIPKDSVVILYRSRDLAGVVELQVEHAHLSFNRHVIYDYINNKVLKE